MNQLIPTQPNVHLKAGHAITTSLAIAEAFGKKHKDVLRAIQNLDCSEEFSRRNFAPSKYPDERGKSQPMFEVTRDGFLFVGMGFTGSTASAMKEAYINAFNAMEAQLAGPAVRPGQAEALRLRRVAEVLAGELLRTNPERRKLLRYRKLGLSVVEIGRLMRMGKATVRRELSLMETCGLLEVTAKLEAQRAMALVNLSGCGGVQ